MKVKNIAKYFVYVFGIILAVFSGYFLVRWVLGRKEEEESTMPEQPKPQSEPKKKSIKEMIQEIAKKYGVDWKLLYAIGKAESGMNPKAANPHSSAYGLFQMIRKTANTVGEWLGITDAYERMKDDVELQIQLAAKLIADELMKISQKPLDIFEMWGIGSPRWIMLRVKKQITEDDLNEAEKAALKNAQKKLKIYNSL